MRFGGRLFIRIAHPSTGQEVYSGAALAASDAAAAETTGSIVFITPASAANPWIERSRARLVSDLQSLAGSREPLPERCGSSPFRI